MIAKLNCDKCKLRTEHVQIFSETSDKFSYKCLKCGNVRESEFKDRLDNYPEDDSTPCGVG